MTLKPTGFLASLLYFKLCTAQDNCLRDGLVDQLRSGGETTSPFSLFTCHFLLLTHFPLLQNLTQPLPLVNGQGLCAAHEIYASGCEQCFGFCGFDVQSRMKASCAGFCVFERSLL